MEVTHRVALHLPACNYLHANFTCLTPLTIASTNALLCRMQIKSRDGGFNSARLSKLDQYGYWTVTYKDGCKTFHPPQLRCTAVAFIQPGPHHRSACLPVYLAPSPSPTTATTDSLAGIHRPLADPSSSKRGLSYGGLLRARQLQAEVVCGRVTCGRQRWILDRQVRLAGGWG